MSEPDDGNPLGLPSTRTLLIGVAALTAIAITVLLIERLSRPPTATTPCADCAEKRKNAVSRYVEYPSESGNGSANGVPFPDSATTSGEPLPGGGVS